MKRLVTQNCMRDTCIKTRQAGQFGLSSREQNNALKIKGPGGAGYHIILKMREAAQYADRTASCWTAQIMRTGINVTTAGPLKLWAEQVTNHMQLGIGHLHRSQRMLQTRNENQGRRYAHLQRSQAGRHVGGGGTHTGRVDKQLCSLVSIWVHRFHVANSRLPSSSGCLAKRTLQAHTCSRRCYC